jgi:hypothetical protein
MPWTIAQSQPRTALLGRVVRREEPGTLLRREPDPGVLHFNGKAAGDGQGRR